MPAVRVRTQCIRGGNDINATRANYSGSGLSQTRDVGYYDANPWGFFDMHGNVWEWTADWYQAAYPTGNLVVDPTGPASGYRVRRGGSLPYLRSAYPQDRSHNLPCWFPTAVGRSNVRKDDGHGVKKGRSGTGLDLMGR